MPPPVDSIRVLIVGNDPLARAGLATLLAGQEGCDVVGQLSDDESLDWAAEVSVFQPDVVLWDAGWEAPAEESQVAGLGRLVEALRETEDGEPDPPVVALLPDDALAAEVWATGARGLLPREAQAGRLVAGLVAVAEGLAVMDRAVAGPLLPVEGPPELPPAEALTPRELEVLQLLAEGLSNRAIALELDISEHTVKFHVNAIMSKLDAQSRTEAVVRATRLGLIIL